VSLQHCAQQLLQLFTYNSDSTVVVQPASGKQLVNWQWRYMAEQQGTPLCVTLEAALAFLYGSGWSGCLQPWAAY